MTHIDMTQVIPREYERVLAVAWPKLAKHERKAQAKRARQPASYRWPHTISVDEPKTDMSPRCKRDIGDRGRTLVLAHLEKGQATVRQISDATGITPNMVQRHLRWADKAGTAKRSHTIKVHGGWAAVWERVT